MVGGVLYVAHSRRDDRYRVKVADLETALLRDKIVIPKAEIYLQRWKVVVVEESQCRLGSRVGLVGNLGWVVFCSVLWPRALEEAGGGNEGEMDTATKRRAVWSSDVEQAANGGPSMRRRPLLS